MSLEWLAILKGQPSLSQLGQNPQFSPANPTPPMVRSLATSPDSFANRLTIIPWSRSLPSKTQAAISFSSSVPCIVSSSNGGFRSRGFVRGHFMVQDSVLFIYFLLVLFCFHPSPRPEKCITHKVTPALHAKGISDKMNGFECNSLLTKFPACNLPGICSLGLNLCRKLLSVTLPSPLSMLILEDYAG